MAATDNLISLHAGEEQLRTRSLAAIEGDAALSDHWNLVAEAMNAIYALTHDHVHGSEDELALHFSASGSSTRPARRSSSRCRANTRRHSTRYAT